MFEQRSHLRVPSKWLAMVSRKVFWGARSPFITGMLPEDGDPRLDSPGHSIPSETGRAEKRVLSRRTKRPCTSMDAALQASAQLETRRSAFEGSSNPVVSLSPSGRAGRASPFHSHSLPVSSHSPVFLPASLISFLLVST
ncbi:hypothetical protein DPEC_G00277580 [Dallia pectoralis]|uniref:Uncharacterized protein n=1 Tax=Dallia pectoralis TaxID=75939 RepID=A0ACC2FLX2_DALPE|nr:hypothetical protein DPEC_G00277580 [Dallia pectoralis]